MHRAALPLIGIGMSDFSDPAEADRGDLADLQTPRLKAMESALDKVRAKFGDAAIEKGLSLRDTRRKTTSSATTSNSRSPEADPDA
jgi:DNA polymerase-4